MIVGVPKEVKKDEYRVGLLPVGADLLTRDGHTVLIEKGAGFSSGFDDQAYEAVGAKIVSAADEVYAKAELIVKVKEPQPPRSPDSAPGRSCSAISTSPPRAS